ncbi:phosphopantetheine-binding protein [Streptomyces sp. NPDC093065]|uniref:phosphopantetheine-binding protein n=1 Tax=Streptomyces sp. NPDC093065 TaxID=3366021 RepID=UPI0037F68AF7
MTVLSPTLQALAIEHIRLAYHYTDTGDLDGHASLLAADASIDAPDVVPGHTRHEPTAFLSDTDRLVVHGTVRMGNAAEPTEFTDVFTFSREALIQSQCRHQSTTTPNRNQEMNTATASLEQVIDLVEEVVGTRGLSKDSNFFEAGGDSLTAAHLSLLLEERLEASVDVFTIYASENLSEIHDALLENVA